MYSEPMISFTFVSVAVVLIGAFWFLSRRSRSGGMSNSSDSSWLFADTGGASGGSDGDCGPSDSGGDCGGGDGGGGGGGD